MISKTLIKQTLKSNWKIWAIFTVIPSIMTILIITVYDPKIIQGMVNMMQNVPGIGEVLDDRIDTMTSLLAMLGENFYLLPGFLLPLIFVIITANSLVASQVDKGSMAYILSTPIKRTKVVRTQAFYLIAAIFCTYSIITSFGLVAVQVKHNALWGQAYTTDVRAAANVLNLSYETVSNDLNLILNNREALHAGAVSRGIDDDVYIVYLNMKKAGITMETRPSEQSEDMHENVSFINRKLAMDEISYDKGVDFSVKGYLLINLGAFLLMFATSGISFLFSCVFNLTKNSLAFGAGIPIAFFIFQLMSQFGSSLEYFKYFSLNSLFVPHEIVIEGTFAPQFAVLFVLGTTLYLIAIKVFKEKDLPL